MSKRIFPRSGAWAVIDGRVGLLHIETRVNRRSGHVSTAQQFHITDDHGNTELIATPDWRSARIARFDEIPASRASLDREAMAALGYV